MQNPTRLPQLPLGRLPLATKLLHAVPAFCGKGIHSYNNKSGTIQSSDETENADGKGTHPIGNKTANALGILDMSGNVAEWCYDKYSENIDTGNAENPTGPSDDTITKRVIRGGNWSENAKCQSVCNRDYNYQGTYYDCGIRLVRTVTE